MESVLCPCCLTQCLITETTLQECHWCKATYRLIISETQDGIFISMMFITPKRVKRTGGVNGRRINGKNPVPARFQTDEGA